LLIEMEMKIYVRMIVEHWLDRQDPMNGVVDELRKMVNDLFD